MHSSERTGVHSFLLNDDDLLGRGREQKRSDAGLCQQQQQVLVSLPPRFLLLLLSALTQGPFSHFDDTITITGTHMQTGEEVGIKLVRRGR